ncbi:hypothetical protein KRZ98_16900 [Sphingobium sp. AS12]|uniref:hypothetical protein n=1 Tax=Sphingobium sp. AS12 TaxID=2849495 RepID=UPI001C31E801|nr:hypothetical protein [Sphingobium sp. AS12]MBV2149925.1 hypothetical protein [Sphingobium sp. AS12]
MTDNFDPADAGCWIARGRQPHHAAALAEAWNCFPDLPNDAPLDARMTRTRERVAMLRPLHDAMTRETEAERQRTNFAFAERQVADGTDDGRYAVILRARDAHGYEWNAAVTYAEGHHAARAGWDSRFKGSERASDIDRRRHAYDHGFRDGGGQPDDIFDAARRAFVATSSKPVHADSPRAARPLPSQWPMPTDVPPPASWHRRLILLGASECASGTLGILSMLRERPGHDAATLYVISAANGLRSLSTPAHEAPDDGADLRERLHAGDYSDILVAADDAEIARIDADAGLLPLVRTMERTRNSVLQQRAQFRLWLARGRAPGEQFAAGHIRWSKMAAGLSGRLGDFTARYAGPAGSRGHRIVVDDASGGPAFGYRTALGQRLHPEIVIGNKRHARTAMADLLRQYAASLRLG